jgi:hypothetical protein
VIRLHVGGGSDSAVSVCQFLLFFLLATTACGGTSASPVASPVPAEARACGALARLDLVETDLLDGRLRIRLPRGTAPFVARRAVGPAPPAALETQLELSDGEGRQLRVIAMELFRRASDDLAASVSRWQGVRAGAVESLEVAAPLDGVFVTPPPDPAPDGGPLVPVGSAVVAGPDGALVDVLFFVSREIVAADGTTECSGFAESLARTLIPGARELSLLARPVQLTDRIALDVPADHVVIRHPGGGYDVHYVYPLLDLDAPHAQLGVYLGTEPSSHVGDVLEMRTVASEMLGLRVDWQVWTTPRAGRRVTHMETMVEVPGGEGLFVHAFLVGSDTRTVEALKAVAETLRQVDSADE